MRLVFLGRNAVAGAVLDAAVAAGWDVPLVVAPEADEGREYGVPPLRDVATRLGLRLASLETLAHEVSNGGAAGTFDVLLSFLFWRKIPTPVFGAARIGGFNMHPGPLPGYRGARGYNYAILEGATRYGATIHWLSERFDDGDIEREVGVDVLPEDTALSLYQRTMRAAAAMTVDFLRETLAGSPPRRRPQVGEGGWASRKEMLALSRITPSDDPATVGLKARAFWFPPFQGATIEIGGEEFTVVDQTVLESLGAAAHGGSQDEEENLE